MTSSHLQNSQSFLGQYNHRFHIRFTLMVAILWGQCTYQKKMRKERKLSSLQNISSKYCNKSTGFIRGLFRHGLHFLWVILFIYCFFLLQLSIIVIFTKSLIKLCSQITKFYYKRNLIFSFFLFFLLIFIILKHSANKCLILGIIDI